jgi:hypothetical protein
MGVDTGRFPGLLADFGNHSGGFALMVWTGGSEPIGPSPAPSGSPDPLAAPWSGLSVRSAVLIPTPLS